MRLDRDLVILGGGCAGLSLAQRLADAGPRAPRTLVLEARETYRDDRTWCFWRTRPHRHERIVAHAWPRVRVATASGGSAVAEAPGMPYQMIRGADFYAAAQAAIAASPDVDLALGARVGAVAPLAGGGFRVETAAGPVTAGAVVDTRPDRRPAPGGARLWQSFRGREIACDTACFDPGTVELMRFSPPRADRVVFTYVLPLAPDRALIETTAFARDPLPAPALAEDLDAAVAAVTFGRGGRALREEHGCLPMGLVAPTPSRTPGLVRAGLMAGGARPSSGYAFRRIQAWADACADALLAGRGPVPAAADGRLLAFMDRLFLRVLAADPARGPDLFAALFRRTPAPRLIRFLSDEPTLLDAAALAAALPPLPFIRALLTPDRAVAGKTALPARVKEAAR
ncbi:lycopene cyclase family protein [Salinarimonas ramus]|uniref:Lycopene cyclase n=1 Tax=Salinarimonas ramus TaxID=690164 RepID=A0A917Q6J4_9HYPH|nr:lycopene cyclase family protein [Salinarimonas ramus]GGK30624.1 lycopene cyclase [Salinarimonas ramus]